MNRRGFLKNALIGDMSGFVLGINDLMDAVEDRRDAAIPVRPSPSTPFHPELWSDDIVRAYQRSIQMSKKLGIRV